MKNIALTMISFFLFIALIMAFQVGGVPDYHNGRSYISYSPDGKYRLDHIYTLNTHRSVRVFTSLSDGKVKAIVPTPNVDGISYNPDFFCDSDCSKCYEHILHANDDPVHLPPSPWSELHAWLSIEFYDLADPQLEVMQISKRYPPVTKKTINN